MGRLAGKVAVITGNSSIGLAVVIAYAREGAKVFSPIFLTNSRTPRERPVGLKKLGAKPSRFQAICGRSSTPPKSWNARFRNSESWTS